MIPYKGKQISLKAVSTKNWCLTRRTVKRVLSYSEALNIVPTLREAFCFPLIIDE